MLPSRRSIVLNTASALSTLPMWFAAESLAADEKQKPKKPTTRPSEQVRLALIGCGGMGRGDAANASRNAKIVAVCDLDAQHLAEAAQQFPGSKPYVDFRHVLERKDIDAVICATVDHWHTLVSIGAMKAGKDVYCEKPLTLTIDEGKRFVETQKQTQRIVQTGTQQRSSTHFRLAADLIRNGRIGKVKSADVWIPAGLHAGPFAPSPAPLGFEYDFWLGQTPKVDYVKERTHRTFRYWWEYSGGTITDWGAHHNDIVLWVMGLDGTGPQSVEGKPLVQMIPGGYTAVSEYDITYTWPNGFVHRCRSTKDSGWNGSVVNKQGQLHGIKFIGTDGWIWVSRGVIEAHDRSILTKPLPTDAPRVYLSNDHMGNFIECVKTRKPTICPADVGHRSATLCHLAATSIRLNRKLHWDSAKEQYLNDPEANTHLAREMRKPYDYSMV